MTPEQRKQVEDSLREGGLLKNHFELKLESFNSVGGAMKEIVMRPSYFEDMQNYFFYGSGLEDLGYSIIRAVRIKHSDNTSHAIRLSGLMALLDYLAGKPTTIMYRGLNDGLLESVYSLNHMLFVPDFVTSLGDEQAYTRRERYLIEDYLKSRVEDALVTMLYSPYPLEQLEGVWSSNFLQFIETSFMQQGSEVLNDNL